MSKDYFQFKKFKVSHRMCPMKVGTDGVLIGAWAEGGKRILDIGTGSGLIALMMAQRHPDSSITAIDIDKDAIAQAKENVSSSPFASQISVLQDDACHPSVINECTFDAIVSNPPFFENSLECPDDSRTKARHTSSLPFDSLFATIERLMSDNGVFSVIVPTDRLNSILSAASMHMLFLCERCDVKTVERKVPKRSMLKFKKKQPEEFLFKTVCLMENSTRSQWYSDICKDFYL